MSAPAIVIATPTPRHDARERWLDGFRELHAKIVQGRASEVDAARYRGAQQQLLASLAARDSRALPPGQRERLLVRVANALPVELVASAGGLRSVALTLNVSSGGFAALITPLPKSGDLYAVALRLPGRGGEVRATAEVVGARVRNRTARVSFRFLDLPPADVERIETFVTGVLLPQLTD